MSAENFSVLRRKLLRWYKRNRRDLPWRRTVDPYAIWISETMLQQTQVKTVLPYYERFLSAFPDIEALAHAPLARVLRLWSGLGYYRRAENLNAAARQIVRQHSGKLPCDYNALRALAGIGDYTAGAILSIAFQQPYPAVDGNARRVLGRLLGIHKESELRQLAGQLVSKTQPGNFNQALMELGATLCVPAAPRCDICPLASDCRSRTQKELPQRSPRASVKFIEVTWPLAVVRHRGKILVRQRAADDLLARLWELPGAPQTGRTKPAGVLRRELNLLSERLGPPHIIGEFRHAITHRRIRAPVYLIECVARSEIRLPGKDWRWIRADRVERRPISSMTKKALNLLAAHEARSA
jgi:A/G-specific adenine glycosylase